VTEQKFHIRTLPNAGPETMARSANRYSRPLLPTEPFIGDAVILRRRVRWLLSSHITPSPKITRAIEKEAARRERQEIQDISEAHLTLKQ